MIKPETDHDIENVEAWAEIIADILHHVPPAKRTQVLALASKNEEIEAQKRKANHGKLTYVDMSKWDAIPPARNNTITRLQSLLIQVFVRDIINNHSPENARDILFVEHPHGTGSRLLEDYLPARK
jgi:hypothetical protein